MSRRSSLSKTIVALIGFSCATNAWAAPITHVVADVNNRHKWDDSNGDTWDPFWADDDNLYSFNCDGRGFGTEKRNLAFNEFTGTEITQLVGKLVNSMDAYGKNTETLADNATWKVCGQECIDGVFYGFVARNIYGKKSGDPHARQTSFNSSLIKSTDHGLTWTRSAKENYDHPMWPGPRFGAPGFIHYGKNGGDVKQDGADRYVYAISNNGFWDEGDNFILGRVRRADISKLQASDWSYWTGGDGALDASWSHDIAKAQLILNKPTQCGWTSPTYIPALNRYVLVSWYSKPLMTQFFKPAGMTYDFYQAEHPWGPWTFVDTFDDKFLGLPRHMYGPNICAKYQQQDKSGDVHVTLFTSGWPPKDVPEGYYKTWEIPLTLKITP